MADTILEHTSEGVTVLSLHRPEALNAFRAHEYGRFVDGLQRAERDDDVGAVVVTGAGRAFSAGADLSLLRGEAEGEPAGPAFDRFLDALGAFEKPLLAAVNGLAVGVGATLLLHCDVVYAAASARLRFPFAALGLVPEAGSTALLPLIVGPQRAAELLFAAEWLTAQEALDLGIVARVVPDGELLAAACGRAAQFAAQSVGALRATKRILLDARRDAVITARRREAEGMRALTGSPENREALVALAEKRPPDFRAARRSGR